MAIDTSMYNRVQVPDIMGGVESGLRMSDMLAQRKLRQAEAQEKQAIKNSFVQNPDGTINQQATLSSLTKVSPEAALKLQEQFNNLAKQKLEAQNLDFERKRNQLDIEGQLLFSVQDQPSLDMAIQKAQSMGIDTSQIPQQYYPALFDSLKGGYLTAKEQMDRMISQRQLGQKDRELDLKDREFAQKRVQKQKERTASRVEGFDISEGAMPTADDAKKVKAAAIQREQITNSLRSLDDLVKEHGTEAFTTFGTASQSMSQLATDARMGAKDLYELGVLTGPDMDLLESVIPDPSDISWAFTVRSQAKVRDKIKRAIEIIEKRADAVAENRGYKRAGRSNTEVPPRTESPASVRLKGDQIEWAD